MAEFEGGFNASEVEPSRPLGVLPDGHYVVMIIESSRDRNSKGTGFYHKLQLEVIEGHHRGRRLFVNLNLQHPKAEAVAIAKADLSAICHAVGVMAPRDSQQLHRIPFVVFVGVRRRKDDATGKRTGEPENFIREYLSQQAYAEKSRPASAATASNAGDSPFRRPV